MLPIFYFNTMYETSLRSSGPIPVQIVTKTFYFQDLSCALFLSYLAHRYHHSKRACRSAFNHPLYPFPLYSLVFAIATPLFIISTPWKAVLVLQGAYFPFQLSYKYCHWLDNNVLLIHLLFQISQKTLYSFICKWSSYLSSMSPLTLLIVPYMLDSSGDLMFLPSNAG